MVGIVRLGINDILRLRLHGKFAGNIPELLLIRLVGQNELLHRMTGIVREPLLQHRLLYIARYEGRASFRHHEVHQHPIGRIVLLVNGHDDGAGLLRPVEYESLDRQHRIAGDGYRRRQRALDISSLLIEQTDGKRIVFRRRNGDIHRQRRIGKLRIDTRYGHRAGSLLRLRITDERTVGTKIHPARKIQRLLAQIGIARQHEFGKHRTARNAQFQQSEYVPESETGFRVAARSDHGIAIRSERSCHISLSGRYLHSHRPRIINRTCGRVRRIIHTVGTGIEPIAGESRRTLPGSVRQSEHGAAAAVVHQKKRVTLVPHDRIVGTQCGTCHLRRRTDGHPALRPYRLRPLRTRKEQHRRSGHRRAKAAHHIPSNLFHSPEFKVNV